VTLIWRLIERVRACALHRPLLFGTDGLSADIRAILETLHDPVPTGKGGRQRKLLTRLQNPRLPTNSLPRVLSIHNQSEREHLWVVRLRVAERGEVPLRISESRLDHGSKAAGNARPVEIAIVHAPGTQYKTLTLLIHALRGRSPYFDGDISLPFPFQFAIKGRESMQ
jgi:hypothetical protein